MTKPARFLLPLFAVLPALPFLLAGFTQAPVYLNIGRTNLVNSPVFGWIPASPQEGGTGGGTVASNLYSGPAYVISATNLSASSYVECSTDLVNWSGFPQDGFQMTLGPTNLTGIAIPPPNTEIMFFRLGAQPR